MSTRDVVDRAANNEIRTPREGEAETAVPMLKVRWVEGQAEFSTPMTPGINDSRQWIVIDSDAVVNLSDRQ